MPQPPLSLEDDVLAEVELLLQYDLGSAFVGVRVHKSAGQRRADAALRLYGKGLISEPDGGYLTTRGWTAAEHAQALWLLLRRDA